MDLYQVIHSSPEIKTVKEYCEQIDSPAFNYISKEKEFLDIIGKDGLTNRERIISSYSSLKEKQDNQNKKDKDLLLKIGTKLFIPTSQVQRIGLLTEGIEVTSTDTIAFKAQKIADIEADEKYVQVTYPMQASSGNFKDEYPSATVWIWCRALSSNFDSPGNGQELLGEIFDITPFIEKLSTTVGGNGGNFQLTLPPLVCELKTETDSSGKTSSTYIIKKQFLKYNTSEGGIPGQDLGYSASGSLLQENTELREHFLFHNIISPNDLIFIRFETLGIDAADRLRDRDHFYIDKTHLAGKIYDMIGLVDSNSLSVSPATNDVVIEIGGRDLIKPFIEDGTYFYALENTQGQLKLAGQSTADNELMQRVFSDNSLYYLSLYFNTSIEHILKFVIQQLSTISIVPSSLFSSYLDRVNTSYTSSPGAAEKSRMERLKKYRDEGISQIYSWRLKLGLEQGSLNNSEGIHTLNNFKNFQESEVTWNKLYSFLKHIRKEKTRLIENNTTSGWKENVYTNNRAVQERIKQNELPSFLYSDGYSLIVYDNLSYTSSPHTDIRSLKECINTIDKYIDLEVSELKIEKEKEYLVETKGIWQIIKLVIDESVSTRRLVDASMSSSNGSLLNFIRKACQEPFVEFYTDTYGDEFYLIVRKPPYDKIGITSLLEGNINTENGKVLKRPVVIDIETSDVLQENLYFDDSEVYSWYHFTPQNVFMGNSQSYSMTFTPALYFKEYAEIWGSKPLEITHNYAPYYPAAKTETGDMSYYEEQAVRDLKYLVDCHCYLPFTRKGQLVLNGDRRLKKGNIIRYKATGEIFFIDQVQQNFSVNDSSIDRTTVLTVSRGMVEDFIYGVDINGLKNVSYFNIINTELTLQQKTYTESYEEKVPVNSSNGKVKVNPNKTTTGSSLYPRAIKYKGYGYSQAPGPGERKIDCSGFVSAVLGIVRRNSEDLMKNSKGFREIPAATAFDFKEGDLIGFDTGDKSFDKGRTYGIDHIGIVIYNPTKQLLEFHESVGGRGVISRPLSDAIRSYRNKSKKIYTGSYGTYSTYSPYEEPEQEYTTVKKQRKYTALDHDSVFSKFKVNKEILNFFLRKEQLLAKDYTKTI